MVNTRRKESSGMAPDTGPRYRTRNSIENGAVIGSSCESDSGGQGGDESVDEESWSSQEKAKDTETKVTPALPKVRELRSSLVYNERKLSQLHLRTRELRSSHNHLSINDRRHTLTVYSQHKMHNDLESDEDCYSPRHHSSRRNRYSKSKSHIARIQRRTELSLRPITRKSYKDQSPFECNSDDSNYRKVRRSTRTRNSGSKNMSWLTDDQMHKIGYPNLRRKIYSDEEDSRDAQNVHSASNTISGNLDLNKSQTRHSRESKQNSKYLYSYESDDLHAPQSKSCVNDRELRMKSERNIEFSNRISNSSAESHDKENKEDNINIRTNGRLRKPKVNEFLTTSSPEEKEYVEEETPENDDNKEEAQENVVEDSEKVVPEEEEDKEESSESDEIRPMRTRTRNLRQRPSFSPRRTRNRKNSSSSSEVCVKSYSLRNRQPKQNKSISNITLRNRIDRNQAIHPRRRFNRRKLSSHSNSSDSSDSEIERRKNNKYSKNDQLISGAGSLNVMPIGPETLDPKVSFKSVGGLDGHIQCLREMVLLPMMYPEVFQMFQVQPPRGVLFHGPPGTGKTLIARALANECSFGSRKLSFFMRKGADLLSKWVGESEKQLRTLFEQAAEMKPSIIFFDELDGLAPVRSSRQDQIHASIVSTLLALMDGLNNRGEVIVIGATNRIDSIDPALRRPGRFDRELFFSLPAQKERHEILKVHVAQWKLPPSDTLISYLSECCVGYCGSDLRALCSEAVIQSFRRTYPQVYTADHRLQLDPENVKVEKIDFLRAKSMLVPAACRVIQNIGNKLPNLVEPLLRKPFKQILEILEKSFPHGSNARLAKVKLSAGIRPAQLLLLGNGSCHGHSMYLAPALLHKMEHISIHTLDLASLYRDVGRSPEESCLQVFHEAKRNVPSIIYIPGIDFFWNLVNETVLAIFTSQLNQIEPNTPVFIFATADRLFDELPEQIKEIFSRYRNEVYEIQMPKAECRLNFFQPLLIDACLKPPKRERVITAEDFPILPRAPTPPPAPLSEEATKKLYAAEERTLRELRIFLRDMCKKLASNRLFFTFTKPVDTEEVPDYPTIIKQPMDLETMMTKVDFHRYECAKDFLDDIELICRNALEYNPARTSADKQLRHRACSLRDYANALIRNEMDSDFEDKCQEIATRRKVRKSGVKKDLPPYLDTPAASGSKSSELPKEAESKQSTPVIVPRVSPSRKRKVPSWQQGYLKKRKRRTVLTESLHTDQNDEKLSSGEESKENHPRTIADKSAKIESTEDDCDDDAEIEHKTAPLTVNCDTTTSLHSKSDNSCNLQSPQIKRRLSNLMSPSELLDDPLAFDDIDQALCEVSAATGIEQNVDVNKIELEDVLQKIVTSTSNKSINSLLDLHHQLCRIIKKYSGTGNRKLLPKELHNELIRFNKENARGT